MRFSKYTFLILYFIIGAASEINAQKVAPACDRVILKSDTIILRKNVILKWKKIDIPIVYRANPDTSHKAPRLASFGFRLYKNGEYYEREFIKGKKINSRSKPFWNLIGGSKVEVLDEELYVLSVFRKEKFVASFAESERRYKLQNGIYEFKILFSCEGSFIERNGVLLVK